ncbi:helix-turn-helix domain-containing protein [Steroidobacter sp. S1-65]|uniref:Helix-turn-helix domain-containing protein n=1 Tax=Steroidobacter gossypii TaxID=2805490 RepID=A0ABS1WZU7_9GAMM|nr:helix-turn-helix domain-containing protein [Steroidobacter gossypii]MBM0106505.1 helix-turn-helix domain-containing protein [Steroidobacter gossypii]
MPEEILTIREVAAVLKLAEKTVYAMAQAGELPAFKVRGQWRIRQVDFDQWLAAQAQGAVHKGQA